MDGGQAAGRRQFLSNQLLHKQPDSFPVGKIFNQVNCLPSATYIDKSLVSKEGHFT